MRLYIIILFILYNVCNGQSNKIPKYLHQLDQEDLDLLSEGFNYLRSRGVLNYYANIHEFHFRMAHNDPREFFPFHGQMIEQMDHLLSSYDSRLRLPTWDLRVQPVYPEQIYYITRGWPEIRRNRPPNSRLSPFAIMRLRSIPINAPYGPFISICSDIHNDVHNFYGGSFGSARSPIDPMFWV